MQRIPFPCHPPEATIQKLEAQFQGTTVLARLSSQSGFRLHCTLPTMLGFAFYILLAL